MERDFSLYYAALSADEAYSEALVKAYGRNRAGDARYSRHTDASVLAAQGKKRAADEAWLAKMRELAAG